MKKFIILCSLVISAITGYGNNIQVSNVIVLSGTNQIQFDISWDNSWRSDVLQNWDAAWVFMKYKDIDGKWKHLSFSNTNNALPAGFASSIPADNNGVFLYRSAAGSGSVSITGARLGIQAQYALGVYDIKVFGIEMVYIPQAPFFAGDFSTSANSYTVSGISSLPTLIKTPNSGGPTSLFDPLYLGSYVNFIFANGFPFGRDSFYCMKYEISQGAYRDFLNTLTYQQQTTRTANAPNSAVGVNAFDNSGIARPYIEIAIPGVSVSSPATYGCDANNNNIFNEPGDGEWVTCNYLGWPDMAAYLCWACLAPMTELQYEKICRGPLQPVGGEYAWATAQVSTNAYTLANAGFTNESVSNLSVNPNEGNASYIVTNPTPVFNAALPLRNGIFATATSNRISSGGSFYGVMDMSGSMWERVITTASQDGRNFFGNNGKGTVDQGGNATDVCYWPGSNIPGSCEINGSRNALGLMYRGGSSNFAATEMRVSNRTAAYLETGTGAARYIDQGGRGVRNL
jgi:formylglycine-generating enzyme required for sulfatase activity